MTPPEHDTECPQPSQRGHGLDSRARAKLITDWPSRQADLKRGEKTPYMSPALLGTSQKLMMSPASRSA